MLIKFWTIKRFERLSMARIRGRLCSSVLSVIFIRTRSSRGFLRQPSEAGLTRFSRGSLRTALGLARREMPPVVLDIVVFSDCLVLFAMCGVSGAKGLRDATRHSTTRLSLAQVVRERERQRTPNAFWGSCLSNNVEGNFIFDSRAILGTYYKPRRSWITGWVAAESSSTNM